MGEKEKKASSKSKKKQATTSKKEGSSGSKTKRKKKTAASTSDKWQWTCCTRHHSMVVLHAVHSQCDCIVLSSHPTIVLLEHWKSFFLWGKFFVLLDQHCEPSHMTLHWEMIIWWPIILLQLWMPLWIMHFHWEPQWLRSKPCVVSCMSQAPWKWGHM